MNRNDLRRVDLNLLIVFETLMHERSVTRAAEKLFLGQPAISAALSRLRSLFDDPLFVRTGRSMEPTARAVEIFALLSPALDSISTAVSRAAEFDPATSTSVFRPAAHAAQAPAGRSAGHRAGGAPGQLHPDAGLAGLR
jgi:LysR family transcriptional activator of mexEF-oprN operon